MFVTMTCAENVSLYCSNNSELCNYKQQTLNHIHNQFSSFVKELVQLIQSFKKLVHQESAQPRFFLLEDEIFPHADWVQVKHLNLPHGIKMKSRNPGDMEFHVRAKDIK